MDLSQFLTKFLFIATALATSLQAHIQMGLVTSSGYVGDREAAWRIKIAGERLGWTVLLDEEEGSQIKNRELDWVICMLPNYRFFHTSYPKYLMVFHPFHYLNEKRMLNSFYTRYDGYLLTINDRETLRQGLERKGKEFHHIRFYPTVYRVPYQRLILNNLVVMAPVWGNRLTDPKFETLYRLLSQANLTKFYGVSPNRNIDPQNYMGAIPFDGSSVISVLQQHGIALVFHSETHNQESIPTSRIFEAAAASTVIISDENAFVKEHFGDSVFYIDTSTSGERIFNQIQEHLYTIFQDTERALGMAEKAHQIFIEHFTMEDQLLQLQAMHEKVIAQREK